jgi:hypothetical protein
MIVDLIQRRKEVENDINRLINQIHAVDQRIRAYLADRQNNPHPRHLEFIEKVQRYRIAPDVSNKHLETLLDNLQWKIYYYQRAWNQLWENAEAAFRQGRTIAAETSAPIADRDEASEISKSKSQYSIETLWEIQQEKLRMFDAADSAETKSEFKQRIYQEYDQLSKTRKPGEEIVMTFDPEEKKCRLDLKK